MKDENDFKDFYNLEKKLFEATEKQRSRDFHKRKKGFKSNLVSASRKSIISKEKLLLMVAIFILGVVSLPMVEAYLIRSKIAVAIQETEVVRKDIADNLIFKNDSPIETLPKHTSVDKKLNQIKINIGKTGKHLVADSGYITLTATISKDKDTVQWKCGAFGKGIHEDYLPSTCKLVKNKR
ncbi:pilin [Francisella sp. 19X1-34]|uniref:pilin n=1 Tax=Francisella sp. 19X1-34 TaxID=3087177 RepID=UPI002E34E8DF|nr:pilin [Francisella sp. 19X1-34]MED7787657.1 pilin [Francisella sp. 19X1-34]